MANDPFDIPKSWDTTERMLFEDVLGGEPEVMNDPRLQIDFNAALFDMTLDVETRAFFMDDLIEYLWTEYRIDFELDFDWLSYQEWYDHQ